MHITAEESVGSYTFEGQEYIFCAESCLEQFKANPRHFLAPHSERATPVENPASIYTCPMDPEVRQIGPGSVSKCGMALEPLVASLNDASNSELDLMTKRFWICLALTIPLLILAMSAMAGNGILAHSVSAKTLSWIEFALATPVTLWGGWPFFQRGWASIINRSLNMFTLIAMGTGAAYGYSVVATLAPQIFPASFRPAEVGVPVYFEAAAAITTLVLLGQVLELRARSRTSAAIKALLELAPKTARRIDSGGREEDVAIEQIRAGDRLRVRPGEKFPSMEACSRARVSSMNRW